MEISGLLSSHAVLMYFTLSFENSFYRMLEVCNGNQGEMKGPVFRLITSPLLEWDSGGNLDITKYKFCHDIYVRNMTLFSSFSLNAATS